MIENDPAVKSYTVTTVPVTLKTPQYWDSSDIIVYDVDSDGNGSLLSLDTHYTVSGANAEDGGSLALTSRVNTGTSTIVVICDPGRTQDVDYIRNDDFPADTHETALDKLTRMVQMTREYLDRTFQWEIYDTTDTTAWTLAQRSSKIAGFDSDGTVKLYDQLTLETFSYQGEHDASTGAPASPSAGQGWYITTAGTFGTISWVEGDYAIYTGTAWVRIPATAGGSGRLEYATVAALTAATNITAVTTGDTVLLKGYYAAGDFGLPISLVVEASTGGVKSHTLADGRYANLYVQDRINVNWFGAFASTSNTTDQREMIQDAIDAARDTGAREVFFPATDATVTRTDWYFVDSVHPTHTDFGLIVWENIRLVGKEHDGVLVSIKAGGSISGKKAVIATDPNEEILENVSFVNISVNADSQTDWAIQLGAHTTSDYVSDSEFRGVNAENGTAGGWRLQAFTTTFSNCKAYHYDSRAQSAWTPSDPANSSLMRGWSIEHGTSMTFESCYAIGYDIGWWIRCVYSNFHALAADRCETAYALIDDAENVFLHGGAEAGKMLLHCNNADNCSVALWTVNIGTKTATYPAFSANHPEYFLQFDGYSYVNILSLTVNTKQGSLTETYDPLNNLVKVGPLARIHFGTAGSWPISATFQNTTTQTWVNSNPFRWTPNAIDMPVSSEVISGGFTIEGEEGTMCILDPAFHESFGVKTLLNLDAKTGVEYKNAFSTDLLVKVLSSITYPDGNIGSDFTEFTLRMDSKADHWDTGVVSDSGGSAVNILSVGHGLSTSDQIFIGVETPYYEGKWTVTKVDADNFTIPAIFITGKTEAKWASYGIEGTASMIRTGDSAGNDVFNYNLNANITAKNSPWLRFYPRECKNTMVAKGKVVDGYTYKITDMGATTSFDGSNVFPAGTAVTFGNGSVVRISDTDHNLTDGNAVVVSGTTSYNGTKYAKVVDVNTWDLYDDSGLTTPTSYVADESGNYNTNVLNNVLVAKSTGYPTDWDTDATLQAQFSAAEITASADWAIRSLCTRVEKTNKSKGSGIYRMRQLQFFAV